MNIKHLEVKRAYYADPENVVVQAWSIDHWVDLGCEPDWTSFNYRIKPKTIRIGEIDVPEPVRVALKRGDIYFVAQLTPIRISEEFSWGDDSTDKRFLSRGLIHLTREAAELHARALILVSGGTTDGLDSGR